MAEVPFNGKLVAPQSWFDLMLPELPGITTDMLRSRLLSGLREFCRESLVWRNEVNGVVLEAGQTVYSVPTGFPATEVVTLLQVSIDNKILCPVTTEEGFARRQNNYGAHTLHNNTFEQPQPGQFRLTLPLEETKKANLHVAIAPKQIEVPEWFHLRYGEVIADGVVGALQQIERRPWTNVANGRKWERRYRLRMKREFNQAMNSFLPMRERPRFGPRFGV